jgi:hypothetical protein
MIIVASPNDEQQAATTSASVAEYEITVARELT